MVSMITCGVQIEVETFYQQDYSNPLQYKFMFGYRITIKNHNQFNIKLHTRYWHITDSNGDKREVEGEGVVGMQPIIYHDDIYQYVSGCNFCTEIGSMYGRYKMENLETKELFDVTIPRFHMIAPMKSN